MGCSGNQKIINKKQNTTANTPAYAINDKQLELLKIIYQDIASRSLYNQMALQDFLLFFHKNGYWGQRLFNQFDTGHSKTITQQQFVKGIVKIFKSTEQQKIQLLYKFFSQDQATQGISFNNLLKMLYNYPKEQFNKILNDSEFVNKQLKANLVGIDRQVQGRRLMSLVPQDIHSSAIAGKAFRLQQASNTQQKLQSKYGTKIINELNKSQYQRTTTFKFKVGQNNVQVKTTSAHQLVKKFAKSIFKNYSIDEKTGRMKLADFKDWNNKNKNFYNDFFKGFHSEVWEINKVTGQPMYLSSTMDYKSKARVFMGQKLYKYAELSLIQSILIICKEQDVKNPVCLICLQGLAAMPIFDSYNGYGIQLSHRNGIYLKKTFYVLNEKIQKQWMKYLAFYKGHSATQIYQFKQQIGIGKFSVVYHCIEKATGQPYAIKVIESYKLDDDSKKIISHESSIMSVMSHPLLVFFKETITTKTHIYIITQLVKGKDLFSFVKDLRYFSEPEAAYILQQIIVGVRYIHSLGIVHRDLKPENIMLQFNEQNSIIGRIKIIDFGFANHLSNLVKLQKEQLLAGTPNYIAPQILKQQQFDYKIDNFAVGSIMYFMLSGNLPFNSIDVGIILQKTIQGAFPLNDKIWKGISEQAKDLVSKLLQNDPKERISLEDALKHPWFQINRGNRQSGTSFSLVRQPSITQKNKKKSAKELY